MSHLIVLSKSAAHWLKADSERGLSAIEYGLLAALLAIVVVKGLNILGANFDGLYLAVASAMAIGS